MTDVDRCSICSLERNEENNGNWVEIEKYGEGGRYESTRLVCAKCYEEKHGLPVDSLPIWRIEGDLYG